MIDLKVFQNLRITPGLIIVHIELTSDPLVDAIGREAIARTAISGRELHLSIRSDLTDEELSVTLYHEILEAMTVASDNPPEGVRMFNEGDFERAAYRAHEKLGEASPENIHRMLQSYGFR
jgi:hypothetical protein